MNKIVEVYVKYSKPDCKIFSPNVFLVYLPVRSWSFVERDMSVLREVISARTFEVRLYCHSSSFPWYTQTLWEIFMIKNKFITFWNKYYKLHFKIGINFSIQFNNEYFSLQARHGKYFYRAFSVNGKGKVEFSVKDVIFVPICMNNQTFSNDCN